MAKYLALNQDLTADWTSDTVTLGPDKRVTFQIQSPADDRVGDFYVDVSNIGGVGDTNWVTLLSGGAPVTLPALTGVALNYIFDVTSGVPLVRVRWVRSGGADPGSLTLTTG